MKHPSPFIIALSVREVRPGDVVVSWFKPHGTREWVKDCCMCVFNREAGHTLVGTIGRDLGFLSHRNGFFTERWSSAGSVTRLAL